MLTNIDNQITTMIIIFFVTLIQVAEGGRLRCNPEQLAERNKPFVIACNATYSITDVYWFKGEDTSDFPILAYENGNQQGTEYQKGEYELTADFNLKIINTQVKNERSYTVRIYFQEHDYETVTTSVRVYDPPSPPCPYVDVCGLSCNGCTISANTSGYLVCYVNGSRPDFDIVWSIDKPVGISHAKQKQLKRYNENRDTWHTERTISYNIDRCGTNATFHCIVDASVSWTANILESYEISVQISSDNCEAPISTDTSNNGKIKLIIICIAIGTAVCFLGLFLFILNRRKVSSKSFQPLEAGTTIEEKKTILINNLLTVYEKFCFVKPLPWEEPIPINALYTAPQCTLTDAKGNISHLNSSKLLEEDFISQNSRILLIADLGHGKTSFTKYFVNKWIMSQRNDIDGTTISASILIHIYLKDVKGNELLSEIIIDTLPTGHKLTSEDIDEILHTYGCIVLFDGLNEMSMSARHVFEEQCNVNVSEETMELTTITVEDDRSKLTITNILGNTIHSSLYHKLKVWVTSRNIDYMNTMFVSPYSKIAFRFTEDDTKTYITMTCKYYLELCGKGSGEDNELERVVQKVEKLLHINEIVQTFNETPLLLMMIIHIISSGLITDNKKYQKENLKKLTTIMTLVMSCLESRYLEKLPKNAKVKNTIKAIKTKLGKLAFENQCEATCESWEQKLGKHLTQTALEIGLLKYSDKVVLDGSLGADLSHSSFTEMIFYHEYFQEYLAAKYISNSNQEWETLDKYIEKSKDEGTIRLLQFMCGLNHPEVHRLFKVLLKKQDMWNNLMDCLYELDDPVKKETILKEFIKKHSTWLTKPTINVKYLERTNHKVAVTEFCEVYGEYDTKLRLGFQEDCAIKFLEEVTLPPLTRLVLTDMRFSESQFVSVITSLALRRCPDTLQFVRCKIPKTFSTKNKERVEEALKTTSMKIHHSEELSLKNLFGYALSFLTGNDVQTHNN